MMVIMKSGATTTQVEQVAKRINQEPSLHAQVVEGEERTVVAALGDVSLVSNMELHTLPGVDQVVPISKPYKLASLQVDSQPTIVDVSGVSVGAGGFTIMAGPCTVESREQTLAVARAVKEGGASILRGGAFKPRTSPFDFRGLGEEALDILGEARAETGLPVVTELTDPAFAESVANATDLIQIGARNMQNYGLLEVAGSLGKPVLLKRGLSSTLEELLQAADYVLKEGGASVILCERGIRTFERATRFTLDLGAVPWLRAHTHLPVIVDPSHAAGDRRLVEPLAAAAAAAGADGIIVEVSDDPEVALCDGAQSLYSSDFAEFAGRVMAHAELARAHENL